MKIRNFSFRKFSIFIIAAVLSGGGPQIALAQVVQVTPSSSTDAISGADGNGWGQGGKPKPTPTPTPGPVADPDGTWTANANGNWSTTTNWLNGIVADNGGFANFSTLNITTNVNVTIDTTSRTVRRLDIGNTNGTNTYKIQNNTLIFDNTANSANAQLNETSGSAGDTIASTVVLNSSLDITNASTATLTISGGITSGTSGTKTITSSTGPVTISGNIGDGSGAIAIVQNGPGTLTLSGNNTFTGGVTIKGGTLSATSSPNALGGSGT